MVTVDSHAAPVINQRIATGYLRVSTGSQAIDGMSLDAQRERIERWCLDNDYILGDRMYADEGLSGRATDRPGVQQAVASACRHRGSILCVVSLSRLARNTAMALAIGAQLDRAGSRLVSISENLDTATPTGRLVWTLLSAVATWEAEVCAERTSAVLAHMRAKRLLVGAVPYGFDLGPDGSTLTPNAAEQATLHRMRIMRGRGVSYARIAATLTADGVPTKAGKSRWLGKVVNAILTREAEIASAA